MSMNGIDISNYQSDMDVRYVDAEFVVVKVTEGTGYINPSWKRHAQQALDSGKLLGFYHYANGGDIYAEADFFLGVLGDWIYKGIIALDWEYGNNERSFHLHNAWVIPWLEYIQNATGATPFLYCGSLVKYNWDHLWIAQYDNYSLSYYQAHPWNEGAYTCEIRQYKGTGGRVVGYGGDVDLNLAYIDKATWLSYIAGHKVEKYVTYEDPRVDKLCQLMNHWCCEMNMHYGQGNRDFPLPRYDFRYGGSTDCSEMVRKCMELADFDTGNIIATYTMANELERLGWIASQPDGNPKKGTILLSTQHHVGLWDGEAVVEFGGDPAYGYVTRHGYYNYPWDYYFNWPEQIMEEVDDMSQYPLYRAYERMIEKYYEVILGREADFGGLMCHVGTCIDRSENPNTKNTALLEVAYNLVGSEEWRNMEDQSGEARVAAFYQAFLGRDASDEEITKWLERCNGDLYLVMDGVFNSPEGENYRKANGIN